MQLSALLSGPSWNRLDESTGIGMGRGDEEFFSRTAVNDPSFAHDKHAVANAAHDRQIVADEAVGHTKFLAELGEKLKHDGLNLNVESRCRLVKDEEAGA